MIRCELITLPPGLKDTHHTLLIKVNDYSTKVKFVNENDVNYIKDLIKTVADNRTIEIIESEVII